jgi:hypothetical protein
MARHLSVRTVVFYAAVGGAALIGCGSLDGNPSGKVPLATLTGELVNAAAVPAARNVRVAVLWRGDKANRFAVAVDLPVQPVFPAKFQIQLTDAPPVSQLYNPFADGSGSPDRGRIPEPAPVDADPSPTPLPSPTPAPAPPSTPPDADNLPSPQPVPMPVGGAECAKPPSGPNCNAAPAYPADFRAALGSVVAYEDTNGNGKLDLVDDNATGFVDRILGVNPNLAVVYLQGTLPARLADSRGVKPVLGYNLFQIGKSCISSTTANVPGSQGDTAQVEDGTVVQADGGNGNSSGGPLSGDAGTGNAEPVPAKPSPASGPVNEPAPNGSTPACTPTKDAWLPITTLYELPLSNDPALGTLMCKSGAGDNSGGTESSGPGIPKVPNARPPVYPVVGTKGLRCFPGGTGYSLEKCTVIDRGLCRGIETSCYSELWYRPTPVPADWPCSAN